MNFSISLWRFWFSFNVGYRDPKEYARLLERLAEPPNPETLRAVFPTK